MAQFAVDCPLRKADFGHELRSNPMCTLLFDRLGKGRTLALERPQSLAELDQGARVVARANFAGVAKLAVSVITDQQRAKSDSTATRIRESPDDELLLVDALELQPV